MVGFQAPGEPGSFLSTEDIETAVGEQFRRARMIRGLSQRSLAARSGVGITAIKSLESGNGSSLASVVRICRALDIVDEWLLTIAPEPAISPLEVVRQQGLLREPKRAPRQTTNAGGGAR